MLKREKPITGQIAGLFFQLTAVPDDCPDSTPVLLLPGLLSDGRQLQRLARLLRRSVLLVDPLGSGRSEAPTEAAAYDFSAQRERLLTLLSTLSLPQVDCAGFSMGGMWAQHALVSAPQQFRHVALVATTATVDPRLRAIVESLLALHRSDVPRATLLRTLHVLCFSARFLEPPSILPMLDALSDGQSHREHAVQGQLQALIAHDLSRQLAHRFGPGCPPDAAKTCAVIAGSEDFLMPPTQQANLAKLVGQPAPVLIPSVGHALWIECPDLLANALRHAMPLRTASSPPKRSDGGSPSSD
ncbi:MAG TPA: alpha/beta hydrolase [Pseudomonadota bacterium]|nr:alpha/beta hydrolase [Pseudomonadota bacterium]HNN50913.1 alpha/beta hydrolase [Pseudomonadota bacterium]HNO68818.1 alpha/beta hydrolase [Pseudomonadota bacterium]